MKEKLVAKIECSVKVCGCSASCSCPACEYSGDWYKENGGCLDFSDCKVTVGWE